MIRHLLLLLTNLGVLAGGVLGVGIVGKTPILGTDECVGAPFVEVDGFTAAQPFAFIDLLRGSWSGTEEGFEATIESSGVFPDAATEVTGPVTARIAFFWGDDRRVLEAELGEGGWSATVANANGDVVVASDLIEVETDVRRLHVRGPASMFAGLPTKDVEWRAVLEAPKATTPATMPARADRCVEGWAGGDEDRDTTVGGGEQQRLDLTDPLLGRLHVNAEAPCVALAAVWATVVESNLEALLEAKHGSHPSDAIGRPDSVALASTRSIRAVEDCPDIVGMALDHVAAVGMTPAFTFRADEVDHFDCKQVREVREELQAFEYASVADYAAGLQVAGAAERERHRGRCGKPDDVILMPGADVAPSTAAGEEVRFAELTVGQCFNLRVGTSDEIFEDPRVVPCEGRHDLQVVETFKLPRKVDYGSQAFFDRIVAGCASDKLIERFEDDKQLRHVDMVPFMPTPHSWDRGERWVACILGDNEGFQLVGDLVGEDAGTTST